MIFASVPSLLHFGGEMAGAVERVGGAPLLDGLFAVVEDQPDGVALRRMSAEDVADLDQQRSGGGAVVGSVELDVAQRIVRLVVADEDDDAVFLAGDISRCSCASSADRRVCWR